MEKCVVTFRARSTVPGLTLTLRLDGQTLVTACLSSEFWDFRHEFDDSQDLAHCLEWEMMNKLPEHTRIDDQGQILDDRWIELTDIALDGVALGQLVYDRAEYHHDFNGTAEATIDKFYGRMGCNGRVKLEFFSPVYLWLLENM